MTDARLLELALADAPTRRRAMEDFVDSAASAHDLRRFREALRERFPIADDVKDATRGLHVDGLLRVADDAYYVFGWAFDDESETKLLTAVSPEGERVELISRIFRHPHADADGFYSSTFNPRASGFVAFFQTTRTDSSHDGWLLISRNADGIALEARCPSAESQPHAVRETILSHLRHDRDGALIEHHAHPAIARIQEKLARSASASDVFEFGTPPASPAVSIIVPTFSRLDLIEHHLAAMSRDDAMRDVELLYVLDSPELADAFRAKLEQLSELYRLPLRGVVMNLNSGFAAACNVVVELARSPRVLFMHSDVVPTSPGWLGEMMKHGGGPVGATLLYHDDSIQHAGYVVDDAGRVATPNKGLHRDLAASAQPSRVDAVSAACMLINRDRFTSGGRLAAGYASGAYEDVDLCARLGGQPTLAPNVFLYHLEGQSLPKRLRELASPYDAWLVARRWREFKSGNGSGT